MVMIHHRSSIDFTNFYQIFFLYCLFFICSEVPIDPLSDDFQQVQLHPGDEIEVIINKGLKSPLKMLDKTLLVSEMLLCEN